MIRKYWKERKCQKGRSVGTWKSECREDIKEDMLSLYCTLSHAKTGDESTKHRGKMVNMQEIYT